MPKLKTHRGAAKRFKKTGAGKFRRGAAFKRHILTSKTHQAEARAARLALVSEQDQDRIERMLPYNRDS